MLDRRLDLTRILQRADSDPEAVERLLLLVYNELHELASRQMKREPAGHTLQTTALVHEAWLRLTGADGEALAWNSRAHFFCAAARAMRRILVERARRVQREKHGGQWKRSPLEAVDEAIRPDNPTGVDFVALDAALTTLAQRDERAARVVDLRYFAGLSAQDTARSLGISERSVAREWNVARAFLANALEARA
jgi:RNA polymerase sigma factor (TIGR02999 family)